MHAAGHDLRERLHQHLGRKLASVPRRCQMAASGIPSLQDFGQLLPEMTMIMLKRFRRDAPAHPPAGSGALELRGTKRYGETAFDWYEATGAAGRGGSQT